MTFQFFSFLAAGIHVLFFILESVVFDKPLGLKIFHQTPEQAAAQKLFAFNQGFYNLFLALGLFYALLSQNSSLAIFCLLCMLGAGLILILSERKLWRGAILQAGPPMIALVLHTTLA